MSRAIAIALVATLLGIGAIGFVSAQESPATTGSACASPVASPISANPTATVAPAAAMASPAASPCAGAQSAQVSTNPTVILADIKFEPTSFAIPANTAVTVTLTNQGAAVHSFNIDELNIHSGDIQPGATATVTINAKPGTYTYYCNIPGHREAGMVGQLTVQ